MKTEWKNRAYISTEPKVLAGCSDCNNYDFADELGIELTPRRCAIILPVVAYILIEAYVDAQGVKTKK